MGNVGVNAAGSFNFYVNTACNQPQPGMTHCVEAHIYPDSIATRANPLWDGSNLVLNSHCTPASLEFMVVNNGTNMNQPAQYSIIQDDVLYAMNHIQLAAGQADTLRVPANGATWTLITQQSPGHPGLDMPLLSIEGCGVGTNGLFDTGYVAMFPQNNQYSFINTLCQPDLGPYDPNAKTPEPLGLGAAGLIDGSQQITYSINFENTGTDTAYLVSVVDTLSPLLDINTLHVVNASSAYTWNIVQNHILEFVFSGINLLDSSVNKTASQGYISFTISPKAGLAAGTQIHNTSYIYFDQNPPVQTNITLNTIGELFAAWLSITEVSDPANIAHCYPNPSTGILMLEYKDNYNDATFEIYDMLGEKVFTQKVTPGTQQLNISSLNNGVYIYKLIGRNDTASGKISKF